MDLEGDRKINTRTNEDTMSLATAQLQANQRNGQQQMNWMNEMFGNGVVQRGLVGPQMQEDYNLHQLAARDPQAYARKVAMAGRGRGQPAPVKFDNRTILTKTPGHSQYGPMGVGTRPGTPGITRGNSLLRSNPFT